MLLGFVGTGTIAKAIITGLCTAEGARDEIWVSPRNSEVAADLSRTFPGVRVASSNQNVLDRCGIVVLSVRPQVAGEVLAPLRFRESHHIVSVIATYSHAALAQLTEPARTVVRAVPLPSVANHVGPIAIYPTDATVVGIFGKLGTVVEAASESAFDALLASTAEMASFFALLDSSAGWLEKKGVSHADAHRYVTAMYHALADTAVRSQGKLFADLIAEHMTKGGLNEQLYLELRRAGAFDANVAGLDRILARIRGET